ncbi:MAG: hypothetical protein FD131_3111 [Rhodocyclaceae bacterium]|nr:MAG: hypothetical protein FD131_3111 [Rhodocyclaceae bacterium]
MQLAPLGLGAIQRTFRLSQFEARGTSRVEPGLNDFERLLARFERLGRNFNLAVEATQVEVLVGNLADQRQTQAVAAETAGQRFSTHRFVVAPDAAPEVELVAQCRGNPVVVVGGATLFAAVEGIAAAFAAPGAGFQTDARQVVGGLQILVGGQCLVDQRIQVSIAEQRPPRRGDRCFSRGDGRRRFRQRRRRAEVVGADGTAAQGDCYGQPENWAKFEMFGGELTHVGFPPTGGHRRRRPAASVCRAPAT